MPLIAGLGNPGKDYERTRHNVGFLVVDELVKRFGFAWSTNPQANALVAEGNVHGVKVVIAKPQTFMNLSGNAVASLAARYGFSPADTWITYDDATLDVGVLRTRRDGSAGGHNGMKSIIASLGTESFPRFRVGIGIPPEPIALEDYVLGRLSPDDQKVIDNAVTKTADVIATSIEHGIVETTQ